MKKYPTLFMFSQEFKKDFRAESISLGYLIEHVGKMKIGKVSYSNRCPHFTSLDGLFGTPDWLEHLWHGTANSKSIERCQ